MDLSYKEKVTNNQELAFWVCDYFLYSLDFSLWLRGETKLLSIVGAQVYTEKTMSGPS